MKKPSLVDDYLRDHAADKNWRLIAANYEDISAVVVVPAYAEKETIFSTLASLARNPVSFLQDSLILCVVNNTKNSPEADIKNNQDTMKMLEALISKESMEKFRPEGDLYGLLTMLADAKINLGYLDASSPGCEMPQETGGVGMARKIGMDTALRLLHNSSSMSKLILSLDADTFVRDNYLCAVKNYFTRRVKTAIVAYAHQMPAPDEEKYAICCYEIFLRYWVLGLKYAKSPYAFHSIGSTIITTTEAYLEVRGMNKRRAGEDFYFLNKLAKIGKIHYLTETCVYPSARPSTRVPFGTGKRIHRFLSGSEQEYLLYDPRIFSILADWLKLMKNPFNYDTEDILLKAAKIHPRLKAFLQSCGFEAFWREIRCHVKEEITLIRQFHDWFDGFKTLKLINYFTREVYPQINMFAALERILSMHGKPDLNLNLQAEIPGLEEQIGILRYLRRIT